MSDDQPRPGPPSVFGAVASRGSTKVATKRSLLTFTHAVEAECLAGLDGAHVFGAFQQAQFYDAARATWAAIAAGARSSHVFADFAEDRPPSTAAVEIHLDPRSTLRREWLVVGDRPSGSVVLAARERRGQDDVPDLERLFDADWSVDPVVVRRAAHICAVTAAAAGEAGAAAVAYELALPVLSEQPDEALRARLEGRLVTLGGS